jgi:hypothetical protein
MKKRIFVNEYTSVTTFSRDLYFWSNLKKRWLRDPFPLIETDGIVSSNFRPDRNTNRKPLTLKAVRRHVRKISKYLPPGIEFVAVARYVGQPDVSFFTRKSN